MKTDPSGHSEEHFALFDKMLGGRLNEAEARELDALLASDAGLRRTYLEYANQHATLYWEQVSPNESLNRELVGAAETPAPKPANVVLMRPLLAVAACIALLLVGVVAGRTLFEAGGTAETQDKPSAGDVVVARVAKTKGCTWGPSALPTEKGSKLTAGRLRLAEGLATIEFTSGATVVLEAPADIELVDAMTCVLHDGALVAQVPPEAQGFVVDTANAHLVDHGTEFGVFVDGKKDTTEVQVFDGEVDVEPRTTREPHRMTAGQRSTVDGGGIEVLDATILESGPGESRAEADAFSKNAVVITTRDGAGRDGYVQSLDTDNHVSETLLLVKNSFEDSGYLRKAYLAFDLSPVAGQKIKNARLRLQIERSGWGYASFVEDATFAVYGVTDESLDRWDAETVDWQTAPANLPGGAAIDSSRAIRLAEFTVPQGRYHGFAGIEGEELATFLNRDGNGVATLIVVRETSETRGGGLVHAFAGRNHPGSLPPALAVEVE